METKEIFVISEPNCTGNYDITYQLVSKAYQLASENNSRVTVVQIGPKNLEFSRKLAKYGAQKILFVECNEKKFYDYYSQIVTKLCKQYNPELILFPGTMLGKGMAATVATSLDTGLTADCIDIQVDEEKGYIFSRAAMNSKIVAQIICVNKCLQMCTVKQNVFQSVIQQEEKEPLIEDVQLTIEDHLSKTLEEISQSILEQNDSVDLVNAHVILGVGRGVSQEDIEKVKELANYYGVEYATTRVLVEEGIMQKNRQIGQSGISVKPELYIAFGISGASQHMVGLKNAKTIVAINNDKSAPIFSYADYAIVADAHEIIQTAYLRMKGEL